MRSRLTRFALTTSLVCTVVACQTPAPEGAKKDTPTSPDLKADATAGAPASATAATPGGAATAAETAATAGTATAPGSAGAPETTAPPVEPMPTTGPADPAAGSAGATAGATAPPAAPVDKTKLVAEVKNKKTSDARAKKALEEAEAGGATVRELAEASNARGVALLGAGEPERATAAFEWARDKDPTYPDASFNLAKQTANAGEIPATVAHLKEVHKRGGKALLKQVGYDPTFEIVKDDPEITKIVK